MEKNINRYCKYYAYSNKSGRRELFTWNVTNQADAIQCLRRNGQRIGFYVEKSAWTGNVLKNIKISA